MPLIRVQLSVPLDEGKRTSLMKSLSETVAGKLGKPESYMMVVLEPGTPILMSGDGDPAAFAEVRSVGSISGDQAKALSGAICEIVGNETGIATDRIYSNFTGVQGSMWGWDRRTFG
jgi:phenylpyruvate tautomerase